MAETDRDKLIEIITRKLIAVRGKDFEVEYEKNGLEDWDNEIDRILSGEQAMTPAEQLAIGIYVAQWRALQIKRDRGAIH
jgi:hypothetical protein